MVRKVVASGLIALACCLLTPTTTALDHNTPHLRELAGNTPKKPAAPAKQAPAAPAKAPAPAAAAAPAPKKEALPNAFDTLTNEPVQQFQPHFLPVPEDKMLPRVANYDYHDAILKTWEGMKARAIDPYDTKLLHRPRSEDPDDAVSEGIGYGMIWALYANDQKYFDYLIDSADKYMWNGDWHEWRVYKNGTLYMLGAATDAEQDIAWILLFAQHLVDKGVWEAHEFPNGDSYADRAQTMMDAMWTFNMIQEAKYLAPGAGWGGKQFVNPGYFAPAYYRIYKKYDKKADKHDWDSLIDSCYKQILNNVGAKKGIIPDWMTPKGQYYKEGLGYNAYLDGRGFYKDAIRTLWRVATDYAWNQEPRAKQFLDNSYKFIESIGGPEAANFFTMDGKPVPKTDIWEFDGGRRTRHRFEHSHLTIGMWATAAYASQGPKGAQPYSDELLKFYENGDYWGKAVDPTGFNEDTDHNELYFDQFLAFFGASLIGGYFVDVTEAI